MIFALSYSLANFVLYCVQQLGVALGVGASTILLVAYLQAQRDRVVDDQEKGFALAVRRVMDFGLFCMIVSGIGIVAIQIMQGQSIAVFSTAFIFKWSLMGIVLFMAVANRGSSLASEIFQGIAGGTWYAIFVIHILAPEAELLDLAIFYGAWLVGFMICWTMMVFAFRGKRGAVPAAAPTRVQTVPPLRPSPNFTAPPAPAAPQVASDVTLTPTAAPAEKKKGFLGSLFASKPKEPEPAPVAAPAPQPTAPQPIAVQLAPRLAPTMSPASAPAQKMQAPIPPAPRPTMQPPVQMQKPVPPPPMPAPVAPPAAPLPPSAPIPPPPPMASVPVPPPAPAPAPVAPEPAPVLSQAPVMHISVAPLPSADQPAAAPFKGLNVMPKNPQDIEKRNTI